jgi:hypothetical protein
LEQAHFDVAAALQPGEAAQSGVDLGEVAAELP